MIAFGFKQYVQGPTHRFRITLDLIFTQLESEVTVITSTKHGNILDHCMVSIDLHLHKLRYPKIVRTVRYHHHHRPFGTVLSGMPSIMESAVQF